MLLHLCFRLKQQLCDVDSWIQTYFQCGSKTGSRRLSETGEVPWSCICTQTGGEEAPLSSGHRRGRRRGCGAILTWWEKLISTNECWQPGAVLWTPPCFCITADVALRPREWRVAWRANRALSDWSSALVLFPLFFFFFSFFKETADSGVYDRSHMYTNE